MEKKRLCKSCGCTLYEYEGESLNDGICGDCGLGAMVGGLPNVVSIEKESGEPLTQEMIQRAVESKEV